MSNDQAHGVLKRLSTVLGYPVEVFYNQSPTDLSDTQELLRLWLATESRPTRMRVLTILRAGLSDTDALDGAHAGQPPDRVP